MSRTTRIILGIVLLVGIGSAVLILRVLTSAGYFTEITEVGTENCRVKTGAVGAEDIVLDKETGWLFISSVDRRKIWTDGTAVRGEILALHQDNLDGAFLPVTQGVPAKFEPHGIDLWVSPDGSVKRLFVVSHELDGDDSIEIFDVTMENGAPVLTHLESVRDEKIRTANDVMGAGARAFYVTNDHRYQGGVMRALEDYLLLSLSDVVYFDGTEAVSAAGSLTYPNGIAMSADGRMVYVAETTDGMVNLYRRDPETGALSQENISRPRIRGGTGLDNITVDEEGRLWIGAHPRLLDFVKHAEDPEVLSPSRVLRMSIDPDAGTEVIEDLYIGSGAQLSGSTVAVPAGDHYLVGSVFEDKILICEGAD